MIEVLGMMTRFSVARGYDNYAVAVMSAYLSKRILARSSFVVTRFLEPKARSTSRSSLSCAATREGSIASGL